MSDHQCKGRRKIRYPAIAILLISTSACGPVQPNTPSTEAERASSDSASTLQAVGVATHRLREHGQAGFSLVDLKKTRDWFTPELYALLVGDMASDGAGYLNSDPFTDAQDDVGPMRFEDVRSAGDTVLVRFSREGYEHKRDSVTLAKRRIDGAWRIANFIYSAPPPCYRDLAVGLARSAAEIGGGHSLNDERCKD